MGVIHERTRLACGRDLLALVEQVSDGLPPAEPEHQAACPHCQGALARIRSTTADLRGLAAEPVAVPSGLARRVMARLRDEQARLALAPGERGRTSVNRAIVAQVANRAALAVPEVAFASAGVGGGEGSVRIEVHLVVAYGPAVARVAGAVRERIARDVAALTGLLVETVDVRVDDLS